MHTIAENVSSKERIVTVVQRLSTWDRPRRICFTNERNMDSKRDDEYRSRQLHRNGGLSYFGGYAGGGIRQGAVDVIATHVKRLRF